MERFQVTLQAGQNIKQEPKVCEWCGKFIVFVSTRLPEERSITKPFDFYLDEKGRLIRDENDLFLVSNEHICKVTCSGCGKLVIIDGGKLYERGKEPMGSGAEVRVFHRCESP
jgi:hypothetical protein